MHRGFIPLHRKTKDNWVYADCNKLGAWCKILMEVNHKPKKTEIEGELVNCNRGQSINSLGTWTRIFGKGWTVAKVRTFLKTLSNDSMIVVEGLRKTTRLTVCNYESYNNTQHRDNTEITQRKHRDNTEITTNKNDNNDNNDNNVFNFKKSFVDLGVDETTLNDWLKVRTKKKAANTETAFKALKTKIEKSGLTANQCIQYSAENSWSGFNIDWVNNSKGNKPMKNAYSDDNYQVGKK